MVTQTKLQERLTALDNELNAISDECSYQIVISPVNDGRPVNGLCRQEYHPCQGSIRAEVDRLINRLPSRNARSVLTYDVREYFFEIMVLGSDKKFHFIASFFTRGDIAGGFSSRATNYRFANAVSNLEKALRIQDESVVDVTPVNGNKKVTMSLPKGATLISAIVVYQDKDGNYITDTQEPV